MMLLSEFGVGITLLLASVGAAGLATSLGAQTLVSVSNPALESDLLELSQVLRVISPGESAAMVWTVVETQPGKQRAVWRALCRFLLAACERGEGLLYPRKVVWVRAMQADNGHTTE